MRKVEVEVGLWLVVVYCFGVVPQVALSKSMPQPDSKSVKVLLGTSGTAPYSETASGDALAATNAAVLGQLLRTDENFDLKPGLVEKWTWDFKTRRYSLTLAKDIKFHNGRLATAHDLEFSLIRGFLSKLRSFYSIYLANLKGVDEIKPGTPFKSGILSGVKVTGPLSVEIELKKPNPSFLHSLVNPYFSLVPIEAMNADYITWKSVPVGAGPYRVAQGFQNGKVVLKKTSAGSPAAPSVVEFYTRIEPVKFDIVCDEFPGVDTEGLVAERTKLPTDVVTLFFTNRNPLSTDKNFRLALTHAIDRAKLTAGIENYGTPTFEMLPSHFWGRHNLSDPYDLEKAKHYLAKVPASLKQQEWPVPVFAGKQFSPQYELIFKRLHEQLLQVGLNFKFYPSQDKFISEKVAEKSPVSISGRVTDYVDPLVMFGSFRATSAYLYERPLKDLPFEALYQIAADSLGKESRVETVRNLSKYIDDNAIAVPIIERYITRFYRTATVKTLGEQSQPLTLFIDRVVAASPDLQ